MPYRVDLRAGPDALDTLIELGAIDVEYSEGRRVAALIPDAVGPQQVAAALGVDDVTVSVAEPRDLGSVWILRPRPIRIGRGVLRLIDSQAFGTGLHPTTAMCLDALDEAIRATSPTAMLDVGTGSGVLALGALILGVPRVVGLDLDDEALRVAAENARINGLGDRLELMRGGPEAIAGTWPLVFANILAAPLIEMAPALVRRIGRDGRLVLSGIPESVEQDVVRAYRYLGMRHVGAKSRAGWVAIVLRASW